MSAEPNPYQAPRMTEEVADSFHDSDSEVVELRRRVVELEKRLGRNWLVSPNQLKRAFGVLGYFFAGYILIVGIGWSILLLINVVLSLSGRPGPFF